jgi:hypothetical protein
LLGFIMGYPSNWPILDNQSNIGRYVRLALKAIIGILACALLALLLFWATRPELAPSWTGFGSFQGAKDFQRAKTLWDWLQLLLIPILIAAGGWWLNNSLKRSDQQVETDRQRQKALDDYFNCMTTLLLEKELRTAKNETDKSLHDESRKIARTRTITVLRILDSQRKGQVIQFLYESQLINKNPTVVLYGADFRYAKLDFVTLTEAEIRGVYFNNASLTGSQLGGADLRGSDFTGADLTNANLEKANLRYAKFTKAKLHYSNRDDILYVGHEFKDARIYH